MAEAGDSIKYPTEDQVIETNRVILDEIKVSPSEKHNLLSRDDISKAISKARDFKDNIWGKAAVLLQELIREHAFLNGNRRTAFAVTKVFLEENGKSLKIARRPDERTLIGIRIRFYTIDEIKEWLKGNAIREYHRQR